MVDKPAIQYVVEEAVAAGLDDVLMIIGRNKNALANHFDRVAELEYTLETKGDNVQAVEGAGVERPRRRALRAAGRPEGPRARRAPGAQARGRPVVRRAPRRRPHRRTRPAAHAACSTSTTSAGATIVALLEVDPASIHLYGAAAVEPTDDPDVVRITDSSRSRPPTCAPSNFAVIGRYVLKPEVFDILEHTKPGKGGEIQLTDALMEMAGDVEGTGGVYGVVFRGRRYDTGDKLDYIKAVVQLAADRDDLGPDLRPWLVEYVAGFDRT